MTRRKKKPRHQIPRNADKIQQCGKTGILTESEIQSSVPADYPSVRPADKNDVAGIFPRNRGKRPASRPRFQARKICILKKLFRYRGNVAGNPDKLRAIRRS